MRYVLRNGELVPAHLAPRQPVQRSSLPAPNIVRDAMDPIVSMTDGQLYDSKSAYYGAVRAAGCEIVGDDKAPFDKKPEYHPQNVAQDIKRAIEELS